MRKRLSGLTVIGITSFSAAKCGPGWSDPSDCSVYMPISPSSAFETYTKVAAPACALKSKDEAAMRIAASKLVCIVYSFLCLGRRRHVAGMAFRRAIDVGPGPRARGPDVSRDPHAAGIVQRAGAHDEESRIRVALAVDRRAAVGAEMAAQRAAAVRGRVVVFPGCALGDPEARARHDGVDGAGGAGRFLAVRAMASAQRRDGGANGVADGSTEAASGEQGGHRVTPFSLCESVL